MIKGISFYVCICVVKVDGKVSGARHQSVWRDVSTDVGVYSQSYIDGKDFTSLTKPLNIPKYM